MRLLGPEPVLISTLLLSGVARIVSSVAKSSPERTATHNASDGILGRRPVEDAGSTTGDSFEFQYHAAARHCCDLLGNSGPDWVLCEWHTDYVIGCGERAEILVSVKHREPRRGPWTLGRLCGTDGQLPVLRTRWEQCGRPPECRFVTNAPLDEAVHALARACCDADAVALETVARREAHRFGCRPADLAKFFRALRFETQLPGRRDIRAANVERHMMPALTRIGLQTLDPWTAYDLVVGEVRAASHDHDERHTNAWLISTAGALDANALLSETIRRRMIDSARLAAVLRPATDGCLNGSEPVDARLLWNAPTAHAAVPRQALSNHLVQVLTSDAESHTAVVLSGPGGFGKTTITQQICQLPAVRSSFSALLWTTLGETVAGAELASHINDLTEQLTGVRPGWADPQQAGIHLSGAIERYGAPVLVVIDDVWHRSQLRPFEPQLAHARLLVTTRNRSVLFDGAIEISVNGMSRQEAGALLTRSVTGLPSTLLHSLLDITGCWPILLAIADKTLGRLTRYGMTPGQAAQHLLDRLRIDGPTALDLANPQSREDAVAATIKVGLRMLPAEAALRYGELAVFAQNSEISIEAAAMLWASTAALARSQADALCLQLAELSLISQFSFQSGTFRIHDVLHSYLRHQVEVGDIRALHSGFLTEAYARLTQDVDGAAFGDEASEHRAWWNLAPSSAYLAEHLAWHLREAGREEELRAVMTDLRWTRRRIRDHGVAAAIADLETVCGPEADTLSRLLQQNAHLLSNVDPLESLGAVLASRLDSAAALGERVKDFRDSLPHPLITNRLPMPDRPPRHLVRTLSGNIGGASSLALSPEGDMIASADRHGTIRVWDSNTGLLLRSFAAKSPVRDIRISPDGNLLVCFHMSDRDFSKLQAFDIERGELTYEHDNILSGNFSSAPSCFLPDGSRLLVLILNVELDEIDLVEIDLATGESHIAIECVGAPRSLGVSSDRSVILTGYWGEGKEGPCEAVAWDYATGEALFVLDGHHDAVSSIQTLGGRDQICTVDDQGTARIWSGDGALIKTMSGLGRLPNVAISPDGLQLASTSPDYEGIKLWNLASGHLKTTLRSRDTWCVPRFAPDGSWIASSHVHPVAESAESTLQIWDAVSEKPVQRITGLIHCTDTFAIDPRGAWIATADGLSPSVRDGDAVVRIWSVELDDKTGSTPRADIIDDCSVVADGTMVVYMTAWGGVVLADATLSQVKYLYDSAGAMMEASPDGQYVALYEGDCVTIRNVSSGIAGPHLADGFDDVSSMLLAPDASWLLTQHTRLEDISSGFFESQSRVWDTATGRLLFEIPNDGLGSDLTVASPNGAWLAVSDRSVMRDADQRVRIVSTATGEAFGELGTHREGIATMLISTCDSWIMTAESRMNREAPADIFLWDAHSWELRARLEGHHWAVDAATISPDGRWLATGDRCGELRIWDVDSATQMIVQSRGEEVAALAFSVDGLRLAACTTNGSWGRLRVWDPTNGAELASMSVDGRIFHCQWTASQLLCVMGERGFYAFQWNE